MYQAFGGRLIQVITIEEPSLGRPTLKRGSIYHSMLQLLRDFDYWPLNRWPLNREEKSLRHVAMAAKFLDEVT